MNKKEFMTELRRMTAQMPQEEANQYTLYYSEMIEDAMEDGSSEEEAVALLGGMDEIAAYIRENHSQIPVQPQNTDTVPRKQVPVWAIVLIILGFPVWFSLLCTLLSLYVVGWALIVSLYAVMISLVAAGIVMLPACFAAANTGMVMLLIGCGLFMIGLAVMMAVGVTVLAWLYVRFTIWLVRKTVAMIGGK